MKRPLLPIVISYCLGLISAHCVSIPIAFVLIFSLIAFLFFVFALFLKKRLHATFLSFFLFWVLGIVSLYPYTDPQRSPSHIIHFTGNKRVNVEGVIDKSPVVTKYRKRFFLKTTHIHTRDSSFAVTGRLLVSIKQSQRTFRYGDRIRFFCYLRQPRNFENPGRFDYVRYLAYRSVFVTAFLRDDRGIIKTGEGEGDRFLLWVEKYREKVREVIDENLSSPAGDILKALIIGEKGTIPDNIKEQFARLGIAHLLAISGLHIGIITFVSYIFFMALLRLYHRALLYIDAFKLAAVFAVFPVIFYCFIAGFHLPTLRAFFMIMAYMVSLLLGRTEDLLNTLFLAAFIILVFLPTSLFDVSFQLSFAAVLSLIVILPVVQPLFHASEADTVFDRRNRVLDKLYRVFTGLFLASAAAILGTAPLIAIAFHRFSFLGFFTNIILVPFVGFLIVPIGLMATMALPFSGLLSQILFKSAGILTDELLVIIAAWSRIDMGEVKTTVPALWEVALFYVILFSFPFLMKRKKVRYFIAGVLSFILIELAVMFYHSQGTGLLQVTFLDVGSGDAALVEFPGRKVMLIDGGGFMDESFDVGKSVIAPFLYKKGIKKVGYAVLSHPHTDHMGGLPYVVENFGVSELWLNSENSSYLAYKRLMMVARKKGVKKRVCSGGSAPVWIDGVQIEVISPPEGEDVSSPVSYSETNNNSLVIKITFGKISFLFTGDIHRERESMLAKSRVPLFSTILKVPHHGAEGSSSEEFARSVSPKVAVISCRSHGRKKLPPQEVVQRYRHIDAQVYRTDINGAIMIETDGKTYNVLPCKTEKDEVLKRRLLTIM